MVRLGGGGGGSCVLWKRRLLLLHDDERSWWLRRILVEFAGGGGGTLPVGDGAATPLGYGEEPTEEKPSRLLDWTTVGLAGCDGCMAPPLLSTDIPKALVLADLCNTDKNCWGVDLCGGGGGGGLE